MSSCKKCRAGAMRVHILSSGFCQECQDEMSWKNGKQEIHRQMQTRQRMAMYEKSKKIIAKKWKDKYGDDDIEQVLGHR